MASTLSWAHMSLTPKNLPETLGTQLRGRPRPGNQAGLWMMVHKEDGASEHGTDAETTACGLIPSRPVSAKAEIPQVHTVLKMATIRGSKSPQSYPKLHSIHRIGKISPQKTQDRHKPRWYECCRSPTETLAEFWLPWPSPPDVTSRNMRWYSSSVPARTGVSVLYPDSWAGLEMHSSISDPTPAVPLCRPCETFSRVLCGCTLYPDFRSTETDTIKGSYLSCSTVKGCDKKLKRTWKQLLLKCPEKQGYSWNKWKRRKWT